LTDEVTLELRYSDESEELNVVAIGDGEEEVLLITGPEGVKSIVESYNAKHPEVKVVVEEVKPAEVVTPVAAGPAAVETPPVEVNNEVSPVVQPVVDKPAEA
jgi:hypothetical protein